MPLNPKMTLTPLEEKQYARHLILEEFGRDAQLKLKAARVLIVGAGGLGSPAALYLAAAGIGRLGLVDFDRIDVSNLQRQVLYGVSQVGLPKTEEAARRLRDLNPHIEVLTFTEKLTASNAEKLLKDFDIVVDGGDNFPTRYLVNDVCVFQNKPLVSGAVLGFEGQISVFNFKSGPCYRCLYPAPPPPEFAPNCSDAGVLGALPGVIGSLQAAEAVKIAAGIGDSVSGRLLVFDALAATFTSFEIAKNLDCPVCGSKPSITRPIDYEEFCALRSELDITPEKLQAMNPRPVIIDVRDAYELAGGFVPGARNIPLARLNAETGLETLLGARPMDLIVLVCQMGGRSTRAARALRAKGFKNARTLRGGTDAWLNCGFPIEKKS